jgi:hypothetical protein
MAFMKPVVTEKQEWAEVETNSGTWWVPFDILSKHEAESARRGDFEPLLQYTEGTRAYNAQSRIKKGYGVRLSAPGYMDVTDWEVYGSKKEAARRAIELAKESEGDYATKKRSLVHATKKSSAEPCIDVVFRVFPAGDVIAIFPSEDYGRGQVMSYQHTGQHGGASRELIKELRSASRKEYGPLLAELKSIGYCLHVRA